ncbi:MAG: type II secretion system F family protein [Candidatus Omnitrophica bacterium]|nr:type II secretion system F family protein [Candidatus Omnitrophota bacterium]
MPVFVYKAKKENAETASGDIIARDSDEAIDLLTQKGLVPVSVEERSSAGGGLLKDLKASAVSLKDMYLFTRQLVGLLKSGVALLQALDVLSRQTRNKYFARVLADVAASVRNGRSFSSTLADYPAVFSSLFVAMAHAGEESGRLKELLSNMTVYFKKQDEISSKIRGALVYPAFMLGVGVLTVVFILAFVMPRITVLFTGMHTQLPWPTLFIMGLSKVVMKGWPFLAVIFAAGAIAGRSFNQAAFFRRVMANLFQLIPFVRDLAFKVDAERFARTLGLLLQSGISILRALEVATPTLSSDELKKDLRRAQESVAGGSGFAEAIRDVSALPEMFAQLISVGEESGELAETLTDIADTYEQDINETTKTLTTLLEPLMILLVGAVVGFIVFAMLMPIFQMDIFAK